MRTHRHRERGHSKVEKAQSGERYPAMTSSFDLVVIGAGPAGEKGAAQAAYLGKKVAIVEASPYPGGIAVSSAGIPTKALRESAIYLSGLGHRAQDLPAPKLSSLNTDPSGDTGPSSILSLLMARKTDVTNLIVQAVRRNLTRHRIELIQGWAHLKPGPKVEVALPNGSTRTLEARVVLLTPGSGPIVPEWNLDDPGVLDSESILNIDKLPASVVVVGGGAVGCEYASIFATLGVSVTLLDQGDRLLPQFDHEVSRVLAESFNAMGIRVIPGGTVNALWRSSKGLELELVSKMTVTADLVLVAVGRKARIQGLGLEEVGVELGPDGNVKVDSRFCTSVEGIFAAGDVIGPPGLAATSMEQARVAMCHAFNFDFKQAVDPFCPRYVFSIPEVASVGQSEAEAKAQEIEFEVGRASFGNNAKARITGFADGLVKLIFRTSDKRLLGVHIVGEVASELIHLGQFVLQEGGTIDSFIHATFAVPTRSEAYKYAAYDGLMRLERRASRSR